VEARDLAYKLNDYNPGIIADDELSAFGHICIE